MSTLYLCPKCNTRSHWANEPCRSVAGGQDRLAPSGMKPEPINGNVTPKGMREKEALPVAQAREFIRKVGRPKVFKSPEAFRVHRKQYMKDWRARNK